MVKILIADKMSSDAGDILKSAGFEVDIKTGLSEGEICDIIGAYEGLLVRSATTVTKRIIEFATNLKIIGRAGVGVDNIDIPAATTKGIIVINSPNGNATTTAEHAIAMMFSLARKIPQANASMQAGKWDKSKFTGTEITGKTLGIIGCGNIGSIVAKKAVGLELKVLAYDPFLTSERAGQLGIDKVELDELLQKADIITLHTPLVEQTKNILNATTLLKTKKGVMVINCARGGLVDETALREAILSGHVGGAAFDVFPVEPIEASNPLIGLPEKVILTPHLGGATNEAQEKVAVDVAEQFIKFFNENEISAAVNAPSLSSKQAPFTKPYITLAGKIGRFVSEIISSAVKSVEVVFDGNFASVNTNVVINALLEGLFIRGFGDLNIINAPAKAKELGVKTIKSIKQSDGEQNRNIVSVKILLETGELNLSAAVFNNEIYSVLDINGHNIRFGLEGKLIWITNEDKPGVVAYVSKILAEAGVNIENFYLGKKGQTAQSVIQISDAISARLIEKIQSFNLIHTAKFINLED